MLLLEKTLEKSRYIGEELPEIMELIDEDMILTPKDVSDLLNKSPETIRRWCRNGKLKTQGGPGHFKISGKDLKEFIYINNR